MKEVIKERIQNLSDKYLETIIGFRRHFHKNPELSFNEKNTANYIQEILAKHGIKVETIGIDHSFIAIIEGKQSGKTIGIRAELDALPIKEEANLDFVSTNNNMHACGHDFHMASILGAGIMLQELHDYWNGKVILVFESGEEQLPGGAKSILESDIFKAIKPDLMIGMHVLPELSVGKVGFCPGRYMASGDELYIDIEGKGGHAALPHTLVDPIVISSQVILNLQTIVSRNAPTSVPTVISFGKVIANGATNVIPDKVHIEGTFRTMDENWRQKVHEIIERNVQGIAKSMGGNASVEIRKGYPSVYNNPELTRHLQLLAVEFMGAENVLSLEPRMTTDDFAFFSQAIPSVFFRIGIGFENSAVTQLHSPKFLINEQAFNFSSPLITWLAVNILE